MAYQRSEYRQQFLPEIDHKNAVWQAYFNVLNSFLMPEMEMVSGSEKGVTYAESSSKISLSRFKYHLGILDGVVHADKSAEFKKESPQSIVDLLKRSDVQDWEWFAYWNRLDQLMRSEGMFTTQKLDMGHL